MKRLALAAFAVASLAACASSPETDMTAPQPQAAQPLAVSLEVIEDYAADSVGALKSPYLGQPVVLEADRAIDPAGRLCKTPQYWESQTSAEIILNKPPQPQAAHDPAPRTALSVTCGNAPFLALVSQPDGSWLTRQGAWVLRIAAPAKPAAPAMPLPLAEAPPPAPMPMTMPAPAATETVKAPEPAKHDPRTLVYLASYKTEAQAKAGFKALSKTSPILAKQKPVTQAVDLGKKGKWVRLYGMATDEGQRKAICAQVGKQVDECGARNRE